MTSAEIAIEKGEAEVALEAAIPALEEAAEALNDLKKDDITEIRSFAKPHVLVQKASPITVPFMFTLLQYSYLSQDLHIACQQLKAGWINRQMQSIECENEQCAGSFCVAKLSTTTCRFVSVL